MSPPVSEIDQVAAKVAAVPVRLDSGPGRPLMAALLMTLAAALFACLNGLVKQTNLMGMDALQISFLRSVFAAGAMLPFLIQPIRKNGFAYLIPQRPFLMLFRGATACVGVIVWMTALTMLPLAEVTAISFAAPLFATIGSAVILRETVRLRRWTAVAIGFFGVLVILRPGMVPLEAGTFWALAAAGGMAMSALLIKLLTRTEPPERIVFWTNVCLTVGTLIPALTVWMPMTPELWLLGIGMGVTGAISHILMTKAFAAADASIVIPFDYARLPFVAIVGYFAFGQVSDYITWIGAAIIASSAIYIARREQQLTKKSRAVQD
ncbi:MULTISPECIES: DMT family transporter [unclassified Hwanghaeella]|jgi:drug/metabolite transporter (DMT)-like permease|uniref:DMT family transporter n=1 Tax=unclassified Hwanghaeella TaxID=2605944 RepID=UPI003B671251|tara:strand:- start:230 stop:1195 length:966 start_codon:yes stop_codon:yes gene_type:complete